MAEAVGLPVGVGWHAVALPGVESEVGKPQAAFVAEQTISVLVDYSVTTVSVVIAYLRHESNHGANCVSRQPPSVTEEGHQLRRSPVTEYCVGEPDLGAPTIELDADGVVIGWLDVGGSDGDV